MATKLDANQVIKAVFDETTQSLKTTPSDATSFQMELDAEDGDSIQTRGISNSETASIDNTFTNIVIAPFDIVGFKSIQLFTDTTTVITGPQVLTLQVSPASSGDVWFNTTTTVTPGTGVDAKALSTIGSVCAVRAQVVTAAAITTGTYDLFVISQGV